MNSDVQREELEVDVLFVGAGPASLASAISLKNKLREKNPNDETSIAVIEKSKEIGQHILSGAVMDPIGMETLFGNEWQSKGCPVESEVSGDDVYFLTSKNAFRFPIHPPLMKNKGFYVVTLSEVVCWMAEQAEALGIEIFPGFPGSELLWEGSQVVGVRTIDQMVDKENKPKENFMAGADIKAKVVVLGEGTRGSLTKSLIEKTSTAGMNPMVYGTGVKEVWEVPEGRFKQGRVIHSAGWPLSMDQYGGAWIYGLKNNRVSIGFVSGLDNKDPHFDPYQTMQEWKTHPFINAILKDGKMLKSGTKTLPEGGLYSIPKLYGNGYLIIGDSASFLNAPRLKGIHTAILSGILASETIGEALEKENFKEEILSIYDQKFRESLLYKELYKVRNFRQSFQGGFLFGMIQVALQMVLGGRDFSDGKKIKPDYQDMSKEFIDKQKSALKSFDGVMTFNKDTGVFHAGSAHEENQPSHLKVLNPEVCLNQCKEEFLNPCVHFCPAAVYEMSKEGLIIHHTNCVHCKTCDIMDPYQIINWTVPVDAGGPNYIGM